MLAACGSEAGLDEVGCDPGLRLNEIQAAGGLFDGADGRQIDWLELYYDPERAEADRIDLAGYAIARSALYVYALDRDLALDAGEHLLLAASVYAFPEGSTVPVTGFDLNRDGDSVLLFGPGRAHEECQREVYPDQHHGFSWAVDPDDSARWCYAATETPGASNAPCLCDGENDEC
jgi:hypothetical protein